MKVHPLVMIAGVGLGLWGLSKLLPEPTPAGYLRVPVQPGVYTSSGVLGSGQYFYVLPEGARWLSAYVTLPNPNPGVISVGGPADKGRSLPVVAPAPSLVTLQWVTSDGLTKTMGITYT